MKQVQCPQWCHGLDGVIHFLNEFEFDFDLSSFFDGKNSASLEKIMHWIMASPISDRTHWKLRERS